MEQIYLDYNATAPLYPEVIARMQELMAVPANPSSVHSYGREARKQLENAGFAGLKIERKADLCVTTVTSGAGKRMKIRYGQDTRPCPGCPA